MTTGETGFVTGQRAASVDGLPIGPRNVRVSLIDSAGTVIAEGSRGVVHDVNTAISVSIASQSCREVGCPVVGGDPDESVCYRGRCVDPECLEADTPECPAPECSEASECPLGCLRPACLGGTCSCFEDLDPTCDEITCGEHATCDDRLRRPCACDPGYVGDGFDCRNVDECAEERDDCDENAVCSDTEGTYTCACAPGFEGDGFACVDPCAQGTAGCADDASCTLRSDGAECVCLPGFTGDGSSCVRGEALVASAGCYDPPLSACTYADDAAGSTP